MTTYELTTGADLIRGTDAADTLRIRPGTLNAGDEDDQVLVANQASLTGVTEIDLDAAFSQLRVIPVDGLLEILAADRRGSERQAALLRRRRDRLT